MRNIYFCISPDKSWQWTKSVTACVQRLADCIEDRLCMCACAAGFYSMRCFNTQANWYGVLRKHIADEYNECVPSWMRSSMCKLCGLFVYLSASLFAYAEIVDGSLVWWIQILKWLILSVCVCVLFFECMMCIFEHSYAQRIYGYSIDLYIRWPHGLPTFNFR